jgi:type IV secretion system protein VirD4
MHVLVAFLRLLFWLFRHLGRASWWLGRTLLRRAAQIGADAPDTHGTARWATFRELVQGGVLAGQGIIVGKKFGRFLRFNSEGYALVFAPTRAGKGVGIVVPNILEWAGSVIVTDPKSENLAVTARDRLRRGPVYSLNVIDPHQSHGFNPLDLVRKGTVHEADDALAIANLVVIPETSGPKHWDARAVQLIAGLILYVKYRYETTPELCNLAKVRSLVAADWKGLQPVLEDAANMPVTSLRDFANAFQGRGDTPEASSILSNVDKALDLFAADRPAGMVTLRSDFDMMDFNRRTASLFICVDEEKLPIYGGFLRVVMGGALIAMTRAKDEAPPAVPTLLVFDEAAAMGRVEQLETGVGYLAGYARMVMVFQDLNQLRRTYPKAESIIANAGCRVAFSVNDLATAKMLADEIGHTTRLSHSQGASQRNTDLIQAQLNEGRAETSRYLLDPSEILRLPRDQALVFFNGAVRHPVLAEKIVYFREAHWRGRFDSWRRPKKRAWWQRPHQTPPPSSRSQPSF